MEPTRAAVRPALQRMAARAGLDGWEADRFWKVFELLTRESLDYTGPGDDGHRFSGICRDGAPWQFCSVLDSGSGRSVRYLTEVGRPSSPLRERTRLTLERMAEVMRLVGAPEHLASAHVLADICPQDDDHIAALWVGFAMGEKAKPRLRLYANNGWGTLSERWLRLVRVLGRLDAAGFAAQLEPLLGVLVPSFSPAGLAFTVPSSSPPCKLYLRPIVSPWASVRVLAAALLGERASTFISSIEEGFGRALESMPDRALVASVSGSSAGSRLDLKLDLCGHCLFASDEDPALVVERLARGLGVGMASYVEALDDLEPRVGRRRHSEVAFVGVGATLAGESRINVYLTPPACEKAQVAAA